MTCSFIDDMNKLDSEKIRHVLEEVYCSLLVVADNMIIQMFQSEGQLHINVYVIGSTENQRKSTLSASKMIILDINVHGINITHESGYSHLSWTRIQVINLNKCMLYMYVSYQCKYDGTNPRS